MKIEIREKGTNKLVGQYKSYSEANYYLARFKNNGDVRNLFISIPN